MKFKSFENLSVESNKPEATEAEVVETSPKKEQLLTRVDRRERPLKDLSNEELIDKAIHEVLTDDQAAAEIVESVNEHLREVSAKREAKHAEEHLEALKNKFGNLSDEELVEEAIFAAIEDPAIAAEVQKRVNQSLHDRAQRAA